MKAGGGGGTQNSLLRQKSLASSLTRSGLGSPDSGIGVAGDGGAGWGLDRYQGMDPNGGRRTRVGGGKDADGAAGGGKLIDVSAGRVPQAQGKLAASIGAGAGLTGAGVEGHREVLGGRAQPSSAHLAKPDAAAVSKIHRAPKGQYVLRTETRVGRADIAMDDVSASSACIVLHDAPATSSCFACTRTHACQQYAPCFAGLQVCLALGPASTRANTRAFHHEPRTDTCR